MATLATAVLPASDMQMQFQGPFVSQTVNRKGAGIIPAGIYRGFTPTALGLTVTIEPDGGTLDSVAVCNTINASLAENYYTVTVRHEGPIVIDYSSIVSYPNYIVLEARYDLTSTTPVDGLSEVRVKVIDPGDLQPYHVILAEVTGGPPVINLAPANFTGGPLVTPNQLLISGMTFLGSASYTGAPLAGTSGVLTTIPTVPATINIVLPVAKTILIMGQSYYFDLGETGAGELNYRVDGIDYPGARALIGVAGANEFMDAGVGFTRPRLLAAGPHTIDFRYLTNGLVPAANTLVGPLDFVVLG